MPAVKRAAARCGTIAGPRSRSLHLEPTLPEPVLDLLAALAVGLIVGLERGWHGRLRAEGGRVAGLRTFALVGLLGGVLGLAGGWPLAAGLLGLAGLAAVAYREGVRASGDLSATSAVAQLLTFALGALAADGEAALAVGAAVVVAVLLNLRPTLHRWLRLIEHRELSAALQLLVLSAVILPLLPDAPYGPYGSLNPYRLWWAVVLVAGLSLSGHVAMRATGRERGALWTGLLGGLASSTAATLALARRVRTDPALLDAASAGVQGACAVMFARVALIAVVLAPSLARSLVPPLALAGAILLVLALWRWKRREGGADPAANVDEVPPFDLGSALAFGAFLGLVSVLAHTLEAGFGAVALYALAALSGLADVDAITVSLARLHATGVLAAPAVALGIGAAVAANTVVKAVLAWLAGGAALGRRVALSHAAALVGAALALAAGHVLGR